MTHTAPPRRIALLLGALALALSTLSLSAVPAVSVDYPAYKDYCGYRVQGDILKKYIDLGDLGSVLKCPTSNERTTPDGVGRYTVFQGGSIYWSPGTGAHPVWGAIRDKWATRGWEGGALKYPTTDEFSLVNGGKGQHFQGGSIYWTSTTGARVVWGAIRNKWGTQNWERGPLGYPTTDEYNIAEGKAQKFQGGVIKWNPLDFQALPVSPGGQGSYEKDYLLFWAPPTLPGGDTATPRVVAREVMQNMAHYFTFTGCGDQLTVGLRCNLETVIGTKEPVEVIAVSDHGFAFKSLEGHIEGAGRTITFRFYAALAQPNPWEIRMHVQAWGPTNPISYSGALNSATVAEYAWSTFAENVREKFPLRDDVYYTY